MTNEEENLPSHEESNRGLILRTVILYLGMAFEGMFGVLLSVSLSGFSAQTSSTLAAATNILTFRFGGMLIGILSGG